MRRSCPDCGSTSVVMFDADEDWCTQCKSRFPGASSFGGYSPLHYCTADMDSHACRLPVTADTQSTTAWEQVTCARCLQTVLTTAREENERLKGELAAAKEGYVELDPSLMALIGELVEGVEPLEEYEQPCALCGTPMFSDEPMEPGEVHGTCKAAVEKLTAENATLRAAVQGKTFFHSDEEVNAEMGRLRAELDALSSTCTGEVKAPSYASIVKELHLTRLALNEAAEEKERYKQALIKLAMRRLLRS